MAERFDPYYTWLGIPPHEQPANHYRLLGISLFESNDEVISNAADRLMLHLRAFQSGKRSKESQQLLNEISAARVCLLDPATKSQYDARLRAAQQVKEAAARPTPPPTAALSPAISPSPISIKVPSARTVAASNRHKKQSSAGLWLLVGSGILLVAAMATGLALLTRGESQTTAQNPSPSSTGTTATQPQNIQNTKTQPTMPQPAEPLVTSSPMAVTPTLEPVPTPISPAPVAVAPEVVPQANPATPTATQPPSESPQPTPARASITPTAIAESAKEVQAKYAAQIAAAKKPDQKLTLVDALRTEASEASGDAARQAALWLEAQRLAASAGDLRLAILLVRDRVDRLQLDLLAEIAELLKTANFSNSQRAENALLVELAWQYADSAVEQDRFDAAEPLLKAAAQAYTKLRNLDAIARLKDRQADVAAMKTEYERIKASFAAFAAAPKDAEANLAIGRYECFFKGTWEAGLSKLAAGGDADLASAAKKDLDKPRAAAAAALAEQWWDIGQKLAPPAKRGVLRRAAEWYLIAMPTLTGNARTAAVRRIEQATPSRGEPTAIVKEGLLHYWGFDEGAGRLAIDTTKNKNHALLLGAGWTRGVCGYALHTRTFNECAHVLSPLAMRQWTIALWMRIDQLQSDGGLFMALGSNPGNVHLYLRSDGLVQANIVNAGNSNPHIRLDPGRWHHIAWRYVATDKAAKAEVFINGESDNQFDANKDVPPILGPAHIGGWSDDDPGRALFGAIDDLRLYGRALSNEEIAVIYAAGQITP